MKEEKKHAPVRRRRREEHGHEMPLNASGLWLFVITLGSVSRGASDASSSIVIQAANPEQGRKECSSKEDVGSRRTLLYCHIPPFSLFLPLH